MRKFLIATVFLAFLAVPMVAYAGHCQAGEVHVPEESPVLAGQCVSQATVDAALQAAQVVEMRTGADAGGGAGGGSSTTLVNPIGGTEQDPSGVSNVPSLLGNVLRALFGVLGSIALLMFIYGGFMWLTSGGNPEKITTGKNTMVWAVLGIAVIFASYAIVAFIIDRLTAV